MEVFKGTSGPWLASEYYADSTTVIDTTGFCVADAPRCQILEGWPDKGYAHWAESTEAHRWISDEQQSANARLIAAAPELLEALQTVKQEVGHFLMHQAPELLSEIDAAIAKALGQ